MASSQRPPEKLIFAPAGNTASHTPPPKGAEQISGQRDAQGPPTDKNLPQQGAPPHGQAAQFTRHEHKGGLQGSDLDPRDPVPQFHAWFDAASAPGSGVAHPETCTLSTASLPSGRVSARIVYLKELDRAGFVIYSNFGTSQKALDLFGGEGPGGPQAPNPWASLTFFWETLERQVRVEGRAERLPTAESQLYFDTRARGSRVGAWASRQSAVLRPTITTATTAAAPGSAAEDKAGKEQEEEEDDGRPMLETWVREAEDRFAGQDHIPVPPHWGGLRIVPERVEFWQGRSSRLHDRFVYERKAGGKESKGTEWVLERLSP